MLESVVRRAGSHVHLVGHSFGGLVALAVALRKRVALASLVILEAPAPEVLRDRGELQHYRAFRQMTDAYFAAFDAGNVNAIAAMIDFYGGVGTFASWPARVRAYAEETTPVNILDWASAYGFALPGRSLAAVQIPALVVRGGTSHPAVQCANALLSECMSRATLGTIETAAHFMIATHANEVGCLIAQHVHSAEAGLRRAASGPDFRQHSAVSFFESRT
jgi:pimeloyl-ACP methyl ester carboxylesterase